MPRFGSLAQPVEQRTFNPLVGSSNLPRPTKQNKHLGNLILSAFLFLSSRARLV